MGRSSFQHVRPGQFGVSDSRYSSVPDPALLLLLGAPSIPRLGQRLVCSVFECRRAILRCLATRDSESLKKVDSFLALQLQLVKALHQRLFRFGSG